VSLEEFPGNPPPQNPTSGGPPRRSHVLVAGESLATVAYDEYGQPGLWRAIARTNGISDPLRLRPGTSLLIPSADDAMALG
jgi:nucleoid-associated protein YgaU